MSLRRPQLWSKGSNCAKGVSSGRWAAAWEGVGFGPGGRGGYIYGGALVAGGVVSVHFLAGKFTLSRRKAKITRS
jgi:hypothetical protein